MIPRAYTGYVLVVTLVAISFVEVVVACQDVPTVVGVQIVSNADGSWDDETKTDPVDYSDDVILRAVVQVSDEDHTYYWGYSSASVSGLGMVYEWESGWADPSIEWKKVMPDMDGQTTSNDPWNPSYGGYTNNVSKDSAGTASCPCIPPYSYSNPGEGESLGVAFGTSGPHNCSELRGVHSRKSDPEAEPDSWDIIVYNHTQVEDDAWSYTDSGGTPSSVGTRRYTIVFELDGETYYSTGKRDSSTVSNLVVYGGYGGGTTDDDYNLGIRDRVMRVVRLSDDSSTFIKYLRSYRLVPWIYGSVSFQAKDRIGFDCADLVAAAAYNAGLYTSYTAYANGLTGNTHILDDGEPYYLSGSTVKDKNGDDADIDISADISVGDLIIIDRDYTAPTFHGDHVVVLYKDEGTSGELDGDDILIHAASCVGMKDTDTLSTVLGAGDKFVMREGW